jgi:hypothetical protein
MEMIIPVLVVVSLRGYDKILAPPCDVIGSPTKSHQFVVIADRIIGLR